MHQFHILTIFPNMFSAVFNDSILKRGQDNKKIAIHTHDLRDYSTDPKRRSVDDRPYGGGAGMLLAAPPLFAAISKIKGRRKARVIYTSPAGKPFNQQTAKRLTKHKNLIIICGRYEGIDERVRAKLVDEEISIGDYVLTGGEIPAMVIVDAVARLVPGVVGKADSLHQESFEQDLLEGPHYTRPANFRGLKVPDVLLSGNHEAIAQWRKEQAILKTKNVRPDLIS